MTLADKRERKEIINFLPNKVWYSLKECCEMKGINYKTACNKTDLQPRNYSVISGRKMYRQDIVFRWLFETDDDLNIA